MYIGKSPADVLIGPTVSSVDISDETIATIDIAADAITGAKIADDAINSEHYTDGSIDNVHVATGLDAVKIADGSVTNAELQYINSLSSNAQTQISAKSPIASPTFTGTVVLPNVPAIVATQLDLKSPLASPTFTGTPAAPTASAATNTTQLATTAFVRTEVTNLIDSAPSALDTLNELAAALGDDASFSTTVTNSIATKLPLAGGTLTGALTGTSATFTDSMAIIDGSNFSWKLRGNGSTLEFFENQVAGVVRFSLTHSGHGTFGAGLTIGGNLTVSGTGTQSFAGGISGTTGTFSGILSSNSHLIVANGYSIKGGSGQEQIINMDGTTINIGGENNIVNTGTGAWTFGGTIASGSASSVGIGTAQADANSAEVGAGYINLARDDTANAKQIQFTKNGSVHSYLETKGTGLAIGGAGVTMTGGDFEVYNADSTFGGKVTQAWNQEHKWEVHGSQSASRSWGFKNDSASYGDFALVSSNARDNTLDTTVMSFDNSQNATFSGSVKATGDGFYAYNNSTHFLVMRATLSNKSEIMYDDADTFSIGTAAEFDGTSYSAKLTLDSSGDATFAGDVTVSANLTATGYLTIGGQRVLSADGTNIYLGDIIGGDGNRAVIIKSADNTALTLDTSQNTHLAGNLYINKADGQFFLQNGSGTNRAYIQYQESPNDLIIASLEAGSDIKFQPAGNNALILNDDLSATFAGRIFGVNGAVGTPTYSFTNSTGVGMYLIADNKLGFAVSSTTRMMIDNFGNVGIGVVPESWQSGWTVLQIGTTGALQSIADQCMLSENLYRDSVDSRWERIGAGGASYINQQDGSVQILVASATSGGSGADSAISWTTALNVSNTGNTTFAGQLKVRTDSAPQLTVSHTNDVSKVELHHYYLSVWNNNEFIFNTSSSGNPSESCRITPSGNFQVGYAATNRTEKLAVEGSAIFAGTIYADSPSSTSSMIVGGTKGGTYAHHELGLYVADDSTGAQSQYPEIYIVNDDSATRNPRTTGISLHNKNTTATNTWSPAIAFSSKEVGSSGTIYDTQYASIAGQDMGQSYNADWRQGALTFWTRGGTAAGDIPMQERMRINNTGNVGIGADSPSTMLDIDSASHNVTQFALSVDGGQLLEMGTAGSSNYSWIKAAHSAYSLSLGGGDSVGHLFIKNDGKVGIATDSPDYPFDVQGGSRFNGYMHYGGSGGSNDVGTISWGSGKFYIRSESGRDLSFGTNGSDGNALVLDTSQNASFSGNVSMTGSAKILNVGGGSASGIVEQIRLSYGASDYHSIKTMYNGVGGENNYIVFDMEDAGGPANRRVLQLQGDGNVTIANHVLPDGDNDANLGSVTKRWQNLYVADMQMNNVGTGGNDVDGTEGSWTIQEGEDDLFLLNRKNGKKYKFKLEVV